VGVILVEYLVKDAQGHLQQPRKLADISTRRCLPFGVRVGRVMLGFGADNRLVSQKPVCVKLLDSGNCSRNGAGLLRGGYLVDLDVDMRIGAKERDRRVCHEIWSTWFILTHFNLSCGSHPYRQLRGYGECGDVTGRGNFFS
jgi:hypothetical protein